MTMGRIPRRTRAASEPFHIGGEPLGTSLLDFWAWAMSDLVSNAQRGVLAEFLVALALGLSDDNRNPWDAYDLLTSNGVKVEVKSCAYLQAWKQKAVSKIIFPIGSSRTWDHESGSSQLSPKKRRQADVYVFCVLKHKVKETLDPLDVGQWVFFVLPTSVLDARLPDQKTAGLARLMKVGAVETPFGGLREAIDVARAAGGGANQTGVVGLTHG